MTGALQMKPIGLVRSPFRQKFGIPRQPGLATTTVQTIEFDPEVVQSSALLGLNGVSHIWVVWWFHDIIAPTSAKTVRPPRLGGEQRIGVFASRSPFRPNPIGLSLCELVDVQGLCLQIRGGDFLDQTPVLDIKPYLPYAECIPDARCDWAATPPVPIQVVASKNVSELAQRDAQIAATLELACDVLRWDPRPPRTSHDANPDKVHATLLGLHNVRFRVHDDTLEILEICDSHH